MATCGCSCGCSCGGCGSNTWPTPFHVLIPLNNQGLNTLDRIAGIGMPGAQIEVEVDNLGVMTATVAANGTWSFPVDYALPIGTHSIRVVHRVGNCVETRYISFRVITAPVIPPPVILMPTEAQVVSSPTLLITGTATPNYFITLCIENGTCVHTYADENGEFMAQYPYLLSNGSYILTASQKDPQTGASSPMISRMFTVAV